MAYIPRGPLTDELDSGLCDGTIRKANPNRGGVVESLTRESREAVLDPRSYGPLGVSDHHAAELTNRYPERSHRYA
ncbi:hypothetical protein GCM10010331_45520 [Streptomyces xanthochromogenes]|uniref:hypothetical protein n=1 Tax=Streptomyces xanthochromogenes TaxID=67384 RepID=UPI001677C3DE|nr:hypothetical protein [Streptomyces xanthochromogenes]GHB52770.1 hypothetical protein GCM10010331_45520 [Streptomyces xanthochromogenes]